MNLIKMMALAIMLALGACSAIAPSVTPEQVEQAKGVSSALGNVYTVTLQSATAWAKLPRCGTPKALPKPVCSTAVGVVKLDGYREIARAALDYLDLVIADAKSSPNAISVAVSAAQNAIAAYRDFKYGEAQ